MLFRCFAGEREFNPIGLVFERLDIVERYRFWQAFRDAKHGHAETLRVVETKFLGHVAGLTRRSIRCAVRGCELLLSEVQLALCTQFLLPMLR
jgi:hypothetical protein